MKQKTTFKTAMAVFTFCFFQITVFAQENPAIPAKNAFMMELNFKPFGEDVISFDHLQIKYKTSDNFAWRLGLAFNRNTMDLPGDDYSPSETHKVTGNEKSTTFGILPGIEYHFMKNSKISPYWGVELSFFNCSVESHYTDFEPRYDHYLERTYYAPVEIDIDGATRKMTSSYRQDSQGYYYYCTTTEYAERAYTSFGGNLLLGCDFYFMRNLYAGIEVGLEYNHVKYKKVTIDTSNQTKHVIPSYTTTSFDFCYNSALRLGFWF